MLIPVCKGLARWPVGAIVFGMVSACAMAQQPPAVIARQIDNHLNKCIKTLQCDTKPCATNGGLKSCYSSVSVEWDKKLERIDASLSARASWCAAHWTALKDAHAAFEEAIMQSPTWADSPYNSDDDMGLQMQQQRYELAYGVITNSACRKAEHPAR